MDIKVGDVFIERAQSWTVIRFVSNVQKQYIETSEVRFGHDKKFSSIDLNFRHSLEDIKRLGQHITAIHYDEVTTCESEQSS